MNAAFVEQCFRATLRTLALDPLQVLRDAARVPDNVIVEEATLHQQKEALSRRDAGEPVREIARSYNVSRSTISRLA